MKGLDYIGWITASSIEDAHRYSGLCDNVKVLESALRREREFKNRKTVIRMLEVRIRKLNRESLTIRPTSPIRQKNRERNNE